MAELTELEKMISEARRALAVWEEYCETARLDPKFRDAERSRLEDKIKALEGFVSVNEHDISNLEEEMNEALNKSIDDFVTIDDETIEAAKTQSEVDNIAKIIIEATDRTVPPPTAIPSTSTTSLVGKIKNRLAEMFSGQKPDASKGDSPDSNNKPSMRK